ncbi:uncharacterized protein LOC127000000 isoform X1 [Eriocheir sinensis]|uniref:uncharacterized protein LOC127000000 isoform X1 n=1 Tax=Eriocheir sinensis TaxID=95602 RepID=UPI0021CA1630|nr:uncharacterized protein LOC127000000 isoform X1 [Eriocheir sinensis]
MYAFHHVDGSGKTYLNPRNAPSDSCPRDDAAIARMGRTCLRKCSNDDDCLSRRKVCLCDGVCGLSCIKPDKECVDLDNPPNGFVDVKGKVVGSVATYSCKEGYHLIGQVTRHCQANGIWTSAPPECRENLYCTDPPVIPNARHNGKEGQTRFEVNQKLQFSCYEGYTTRGFFEAKCLLYNNTMQWFGPEIECEPKTCGDPGDILNGVKEGNCFTFSCRVTYNCRPGFELVGANNYYCQHDGTWRPRELPACTPVQCDIPENPENGKAIFIAVSYNAVVSYECEYGFMIVGSPTRRCGPDKKWSDVEPKCKQVNCGSPGLLYNGWTEGSKTTLGAIVEFRCHDNMLYEGHPNHRAKCLQNGTWSHPLPRCFAPCIVPTIEHGRIRNETRSGMQVSHGQTIDVQCNENYELAYSQAPSLCYNGTWTNYPRCQPARCKRLPERPRHGMVIAPKTDHGRLARFRCKDGYVPDVNITYTKCHYGNWTNPTPKCIEVYCPFPGELPNGRVLLVGNMGMYDYRSYVKKVKNNRQLRFSCNRGYFLVEGPPGATCVHGTWSPKEMPRCKPDMHPRLRWVKRSLDEEQLLPTTPMPILDASRWDEDEGGEDEDEEEEFEMHEEEMEKEEKEEEEEDEDNMIQGEASDFEARMKTGGGRWKKMQIPITSDSITPSPLPTDNPSRPLYPSTLLLGLLHSGTPQDGRVKASLGRTLRGPLADYYKVMKDENKTLASSSGPVVRVPRNVIEKEKKRKRRNKWKKKGKRDSPSPVPHCDPIPSQPYLRVEVARRGRDSNYTYSAGARIKVTCLHGYGLNIGNRTAKCARRGKWKPKKPECVTLPCSVPKKSHGQFVYGGVNVQPRAVINHGEEVKFTCQSGYTVIGSVTMRCWYGTWAATAKAPECVANNCELPELSNGKYNSGYKKGLTIIHGASIPYTCDEGYLMSAHDVSCYLGLLRPAPPACIRPVQILPKLVEQVVSPHPLPAPVPIKKDEPTPDNRGGDNSGLKRESCGPPVVVPDSQGFARDLPISEDWTYQDGEEVTFTCKTNNIGVKTTWKVTCMNGTWQGGRSLFTCGADGADSTDATSKPGEEHEEEVDYGTQPCKWEKSEPKVVTFFGDQELTEEATFQPADELVSRCVDIGKYALIGSVRRRCKDGGWTGEKPICQGLSQENDYSLDKPPTILFRHEHGPMAQSNDGKLVVFPDTVLHLECLFRRRHGTPKWNVSLSSSFLRGKKRRRKGSKKGMKGGGKPRTGGTLVPYPNGWANAPGRNMQLEYRLTISKAQPKDSGAYACTTPMGHKHVVTVEIKSVYCPSMESYNLTEYNPQLVYEPPNDHKLSTEINFSCVPGFSLIGAPMIKCLPSGNWSAPIPDCEMDKCVPPAPPENGIMTGESKPPYHAGDVVEVKCDSNYMLEGKQLLVCQEDGQWSAEVPKCLLACTYPGTIISGTMSSIKFYYPINDNITYTCSEGFVLDGARSIVCLEGGSWSAQVPTCLPVE